MTAELALRRGHLADHRRMIIGRAIAASMTGMIPVPIFEEWLTSTVKRGTIRRIAERRNVDMDAEAIRAVADGSESPPSWTELATGTLLYKVLSRAWRKALIAYLATRRTQAAVRYFVVGTLFDHYCARVHVGLGLDGPAATELRSLIDEAIEVTPGSLGSAAFKRGAVATARATVQAPVELLDIASGGMLRRLLRRGDEVEAIEEIDSAIEAQLASQKSFLSRSTTAVELQLSAEANPYLENLLSVFEELWRRRQCEARPK